MRLIANPQRHVPQVFWILRLCEQQKHLQAVTLFHPDLDFPGASADPAAGASDHEELSVFKLLKGRLLSREE